MEQRPTSILAALAIFAQALTLIAPWVPGQDPDRIAEIRRLADQGDVDAQFTLGTIYSFSQIIYANGGRAGPESDPAEAAKWYRLAAGQGHAIAQNNLGLIYANGTGVPQDDVLAYAWLNLAGEQGNELASGNKDKLRTRMTANQIARAQELSATLFDRINFASEAPGAKTGVMHGSASERRQ